METTTWSSETTKTRRDEDIQRDVLAELEWDARLRPNEIGVAVKSGVVTLLGKVDSYLKKWNAESAALRVRGVRGVANELKVELTPSDEHSDEEIAQAVLRALEWDALVPADKIQVSVSDGWVTLKGEVYWQYEKRDAERVVRRLAGVKGVINLIMLKSTASPTDVKKHIEEALVRSVKVDAERIQVEALGRKVILRGKVRSWAERDEAERAAWMAPGVTEVDNQLTISRD